MRFCHRKIRESAHLKQTKSLGSDPPFLCGFAGGEGRRAKITMALTSSSHLAKEAFIFASPSCVHGSALELSPSAFRIPV
jgi:hypothetical protein